MDRHALSKAYLYAYNFSRSKPINRIAEAVSTLEAIMAVDAVGDGGRLPAGNGDGWNARPAIVASGHCSAGTGQKRITARRRILSRDRETPAVYTIIDKYLE